MAYNDLPTDEKALYDEIAGSVKVDVVQLNEVDILLDLIRRIKILEEKCAKL